MRPEHAVNAGAADAKATRDGSRSEFFFIAQVPQLNRIDRGFTAFVNTKGLRGLDAFELARPCCTDRRQADFFGAPASAPGTPKPKPEQATKRRPPSPNGKLEPVSDSFDVIAARPSPAELKQFVAALPDDALACLAIATARQLIAELGGQDEGDDGW